MNESITYRPVIGLEIHIELKTNSKMFCGCSADHFGKPPNTQTCPVCLGLPGALPVPNRKAVEWTILTGLALNCQIPLESKFDRKNYFYPDLPKGYQISQYDQPLAVQGKIQVNEDWIRINRVHLEEDTGKLLHQVIKGEKWTLIDFNRSGVPLMEIVTEPDLTSAEQARQLLEKLQKIVRYLGVADADMEKGQMRCEPTVNLKITQEGQVFNTPLVEIKNINSFRFVAKAIDFEIERQFTEFQKTRLVKEVGNKSTRGWDEKNQKTVLQRVKEEASDYRYFPEPDIPPMRWSKSNISEFRKQLPQLPDEREKRLVSVYDLKESYVRILTETREMANFFEEAVKLGKKKKIRAVQIANFVVNKKIKSSEMSAEKLIKMIKSASRKSDYSLQQLEKIVRKVLAENQRATDDYRQGKRTAVEYLVGQVLRQTKGLADPNQAKPIIIKLLNHG